MKWKDRKVLASRPNLRPDRNTVRATRAVAAALFTGIALLDRFYQIGPLISGKKGVPEVWQPDSNLLFPQNGAPEQRPSFRVMTLNTAHGRKEGSHQLLQSRQAVKNNLDDIAAMLRREKPDLVALQEVDAPSAWSGMFDHLKHLSEGAAFSHSVLGEHVKGRRNAYGTALVSSLPLEEPLSIRFSPAPPTFAKGAVISTIRLPDAPNTAIDVISLHLDFARKSVRLRQVEELVQKIKSRRRPLIVMGDFNCEWTTGESTLPWLAERLGLRAFRPEATSLVTHPASERRLDWILLSDELVFRSYRTLRDPLSDHLAVMADVALDPANGEP